MFSKQSLHVAMLMWGCIFNLIALLCMYMSKNFDKEKRKWLMLMQMDCALLLFNDALAWGFRGAAGATAGVMVRVSNFLVFILTDFIIFIFHGYVSTYLFEEKSEEERPGRRIMIGYIAALAAAALVVVSQFTDLYYYIDADNFYHRNPGYIVSFIFPIIVMIIDLQMIIQYRKNIDNKIFVSLILYIILPFVMTLVQILYYGISLINIAICISAILMFIMATAEQNMRLAKKENEAAQLEISLLMSRIAPHFIYNTLATIKRLCVSDPELARQTVSEFSGYLRCNLETLTGEQRIPFSRELECVKYYTSIEKRRFGDRVNVEFEINVEDFLIPGLTLQPLVENAIKHGICKKDEGGTVRISTEEKDGIIYIIVSDDGVGFDVDKINNDESIHIGINNVRQRLEDICNGKLEIHSTAGRGTMVAVTLPRKDRI
ncbi:MAG: histidine kinase [Lachnospira sp.]|nr:histidine kinase [Lachnospira sp.]